MCRPGQRDVMRPRGITYNVKLILHPRRETVPSSKPPSIYVKLASIVPAEKGTETTHELGLLYGCFNNFCDAQ